MTHLKILVPSMPCDPRDFGDTTNVEGTESLLHLLPANQRHSAMRTMWLSRDCARVYQNHRAEWFIGGLITSRKCSIDIIRSHAASHLHLCYLWNSLKMETAVSSKRCHLYTNVHGIKPQKTGIIFYNFHKLREFSALRGVGKSKFSAFISFCSAVRIWNYPFPLTIAGYIYLQLQHKASPPPLDTWNTEVTHVGIYFSPPDSKLCFIYVALTHSLP